MLYAAMQAYEAVTGKEMPENDIPHPTKPGDPWEEDSVGSKYPELAAKFWIG